MQTEPSFKVSPADHALIMRCVDRYANFVENMLGQPVDKLSLMMDLTACHANGNPLRLADLANTKDDFSFIHDVGGIRQHLNRDTGQLEDFFSPRFSRRANVRAVSA